MPERPRWLPLVVLLAGAACGGPSAPPIAVAPIAIDEPPSLPAVEEDERRAWRFYADGNHLFYATAEEAGRARFTAAQHYRAGERWLAWDLANAPEPAVIEGVTEAVSLRMHAESACEIGRVMAVRLEARGVPYALSLSGRWPAESLACLDSLHPAAVFAYDESAREHALRHATWRGEIVAFATSQLRPSDVASLSELRALRVLGVGRSVDGDTVRAIAALDLEGLYLDGVASMQPIAHMSGLRRLAVSGMRAADVSPLGALDGLRELSLSRVGVGGGLDGLRGLTALHHLTLRRCGIERLDGLREMSQLETLDVYGNEELTSLDGLAAPALRSLDAAQTGLAPGSLEALRASPGLERLDVRGAPIDGASLAPLAGLAQLRLLDLSETAVDDEGLAHLAGLSSLETLELFGAQRITGSGFSHLRGLTSLRHMTFDATSVGPEGLGQRMQLSQLDQQLLSLGYLQIGAGLDALEGNEDVRELVLWTTDVDDDALEHIAGLTQLTFLSLGRTPITDAGLAHLARLENLTRLRLNATQITGAGLRHLARMQRLERLELDDAHVDDEGIAQLPALAALSQLSLASTQITDRAVRHIARQPALRRLSINETAITDAAIDELLAIGTLERVSVGGSTTLEDGTEVTSAMTPEGRARLTEALEARVARRGD